MNKDSVIAFLRKKGILSKDSQKWILHFKQDDESHYSGPEYVDLIGLFVEFCNQPKQTEMNKTSIRLHNDSIVIEKVNAEKTFYNPDKVEYVIYAIPAELSSQFRPGEKVVFSGSTVRIKDSELEIIKKDQILLTYDN